MRETAGRTFQGKGTAERRTLGGRGSGIGERGRRAREVVGNEAREVAGTLSFTQNTGLSSSEQRGMGSD